MKKFFTLIAFTSAFVPAIHGMEADLFADARKKYDYMIQLIKKADIEAFKRAFDEAKLPSSNSLRVNAAKMETIKAVLVLEQVAFETKAEISKELEALGDSNKNWSKITKGGLATLGGAFIGVAGINDIVSCFSGNKSKETICKILVIYTLGFPVAYKSLTYGYENLKVGLNYKQHLQDKLTNLDAIAAHIAHAKTQVAHA